MKPYYEHGRATVYVGDCRETLSMLPGESIHCVVTSPPYWSLRDYGIEPTVWGGEADCCHEWGESVERVLQSGGTTEKQSTHIGNDGTGFTATGQFCRHCNAWLGCLGLEPTPQLFVEHIVEVVRHVWRVLRDDGTCWVNFGDSYCNAGSSRNGEGLDGCRRGGATGADGSLGYKQNDKRRSLRESGIKHKDLCGIPWRVAFALQDDGWYLRRDIIWSKKSPMPESCRDRPTTAHEYVFLLTKRPRYFYDAEAVREDARYPNDRRKPYAPGQVDGRGNGHDRGGGTPDYIKTDGRNLRSVWTLGPESFSDAHFATFPSQLPATCILAGTSERGCCPDCGAPWERIVETSPMVIERSDRREQMGEFGRTQASGTVVKPRESTTTGWQPTCDCGTDVEDLQEGDLEIISTPTGHRSGEDTTMITGRRGMNRPRGDDEGVRPITRYEQRKYAEQLRCSPNRKCMEREAGSAFAHYIRTDKSGARPVPEHLLSAWIEREWIERVNCPQRTPHDPQPCTVLDPFGGSGTVAGVCEVLGREAVLCEAKSEYADMMPTRIRSIVHRYRGGPIIQRQPKSLEGQRALF